MLLLNNLILQNVYIYTIAVVLTAGNYCDSIAT